MRENLDEIILRAEAIKGTGGVNDIQTLAELTILLAQTLLERRYGKPVDINEALRSDTQPPAQSPQRPLDGRERDR